MENDKRYFVAGLFIIVLILSSVQIETNNPRPSS